MKRTLLTVVALLLAATGMQAQVGSNVNSQVGASAGLIANADLPVAANIIETYTIENRRCSDGEPEVKPMEDRPEGTYCWTVWVERVHNLTTTEGLNDLLDKYFKGSTYTATWYCGLVDNAGFTTYAAGDTAAAITTDASGANQWGEASEYDEANRPTITLGTPTGGSVDNSASKCVFTMSASLTIRGAFVISNNTKLGTTGVLYGVADFSAARAVLDNDTLNVTVTLTAS